MTSVPTLDAAEQRVLGSLMEKQVTVPSTYPLTLNSLRTACNQSTSRDPVVSYDDQLVEQTARALKGRGLIRVVWEGSRSLKYHQLLDEVLDLESDEHALLTVLLLRGAQSAGELKTRTDRLHGFADRSEVEAALSRLAAREEPLVQELAKRPGWQDPRWIHLLGPVDIPGGPAESAASAALDLDAPIAGGAQARDAAVLAAFDAAAQNLGERRDPSPFEAWVLDRIVALADGRPIADAACGPGHVAAALAERGAEVAGSDVSGRMVDQARAAYGGIEFEVRDLRRLMRPAGADGWGVTLAFGALELFAESELREVLAALARPLARDGYVVLTCEVGPAVTEAGGEDGPGLVRVQHDPRKVIAAAQGAGLTDLDWYRHGATGSDEMLYLIGRRP
ncbi:MAG: DUF480 domain-containing protein [Actinomycetia bacterium]|nr:DUF480 domain-containing protein [Actinomycetes bacterium]